MAYPYKKAALGGTFDHFHKGHEVLINTALTAAHDLIIGLTQPLLYTSKHHAQRIQTYQQRQQEIQTFLTQRVATNRSHIIPLTDIYGTTLEDPDIDCLVVSEQTKPGAEAINQARAERQLAPLPVIVAPMQVDSSGEHISSTRIRTGKINRDGFVYAQLFKNTLKLNQIQRDFLSQVHGELVTSLDSSDIAKWMQPTVLVGDYVTQWWLDHNLPFSHAIIDGQNERNSFTLNWSDSKPSANFSTTNPAGHISHQAAATLSQMLEQPSGLCQVEGEEDLLAVPALISMPLSSRLVYGQPGQGMVIWQATESFKDTLTQLINSPSEK